MKIKLLFIVFLLLPIISFAQKKQSWNSPLYDAYPYHWGFAFNFGVLDFSLNHDKSILTADSVINIEAGMGFNFGAAIVGNMRINEYLDLRLLPGLTFGSRALHYTVNKPDVDYAVLETKRISSTHIQIPLLLKYRAVRESNYRPYFIGGINYTIDVGTNKSTKKNRDESQYIPVLNRQDIMLEIGFGVDYYLPYFKHTTEIRFSYGLLDMLKHDETAYTRHIEKLGSKMVTLVLYFE